MGHPSVPLRGRLPLVGPGLTRPCSTPSPFGWGGRIRTFEYGIQSPAPYRLATPHQDLRIRAHRDRSGEHLSAVCEEADLRSGPDFAAQTVSLYDGLDGDKPLVTAAADGAAQPGTASADG